jgi:CheY-like chemotaxis protein
MSGSLIAPAGPGDARVPRPGLCVLVAEDDEADAYLICGALARLPAVGEVIRVADGLEALRVVEQGDFIPDLALIDLGLLVALAERPEPGFPMVVLTSSSAPVDAMRSRLRGAIRVIRKPDTTEALDAELAAAIGAVCAGGTGDARRLTAFKSAFHGVPSTPYLIALEDEAEAPTPGQLPT